MKKEGWIFIIVVIILIIILGFFVQNRSEKLTKNFILLVSDAPADIDDFDSLEVTFSSARIFRQNSNFEEVALNNVAVNLKDITDEKAAELASTYLSPGVYTKIELHVNSTNGIVNGSAVEVMVPSNKLQITKTFEIFEDSPTEFVFDINVVKTGNQDKYNLLPVISESGVVGKDISAPAEVDATS